MWFILRCILRIIETIYYTLIGNNLERVGHDLIEILFRNFAGRTEESHEKPQSG
jgi:hypothetical protein